MGIFCNDHIHWQNPLYVLKSSNEKSLVVQRFSGLGFFLIGKKKKKRKNTIIKVKTNVWLTHPLSHLYSHSTLSLKDFLSKEVMHRNMTVVNQADTTQRSQFTNFTERTVILKDVTFFRGAGKRRRTETQEQLKWF